MYKYFLVVSALLFFVSGFASSLPSSFQENGPIARGGDRGGGDRDDGYIQHPYGAAAEAGYNRSSEESSGSYYMPENEAPVQDYQTQPQNPYMLPQQQTAPNPYQLQAPSYNPV